MSRLAVFGAGGHGRVVAEAALSQAWTSVTFFDDGQHAGHALSPGPVLGNFSELERLAGEFDGVIVAIGNNARRLDFHRRLAAAGGRMATIAHRHASVSSRAHLGAGTVVLAGAVVVIGARLGEAVIVNTAATVDHDCVLADAVHVSPGAHLAGGVTVGARSWLGIGCVVRENVDIGADVIAGAGAVIVHSCANGITVLGNPARPANPS